MINKSRKFAFYTYTNPQTGKVVHDNMPWRDWEQIQSDRVRKHQFKLERMIDLDANTQEVFTPRPPEIIEDKLQCPLCGFVAANDNGMRLHKTKKHG